MRCFLQWLMMTLTMGVTFFFALYNNLIYEVWKGDVSHMSSVIAALLAVTVLYLGFASWNFDKHNNLTRAFADINLARTSAYLVTLIGIIGTAIGIMLQVRAIGVIDVNNAAQFIQQVGSSLATAFYATICGITASAAITALNANLEYFVDLKDTNAPSS